MWKWLFKLLKINSDDKEYMFEKAFGGNSGVLLSYLRFEIPNKIMEAFYKDIPIIRFAGTSKEFREQDETIKKKKLLNLFLSFYDKFIDVLEFFVNFKRNTSYFIYRRFFNGVNPKIRSKDVYAGFIEQWQENILKVDYLSSFDKMFFHSFASLADFVEVECARAEGYRPEFEFLFLEGAESYRNEAAGIKYINKQIEGWRSELLPNDHSTREFMEGYIKLKELYLWFRYELPILEKEAAKDCDPYREIELDDDEWYNKPELVNCVEERIALVKKLEQTRKDKLKELVDCMVYAEI